MFWLHWVFVACARAFSSCGEWGLLLVAVSGHLLATASLVAGHRLSTVMHGLTCSMALGIFLDQESNPCPLHWQADSYHLDHQEVPSSGSQLLYSLLGLPWVTNLVERGVAPEARSNRTLLHPPRSPRGDCSGEVCLQLRTLGQHPVERYACREPRLVPTASTHLTVMCGNPVGRGSSAPVKPFHDSSLR